LGDWSSLTNEEDEPRRNIRAIEYKRITNLDTGETVRGSRSTRAPSESIHSFKGQRVMT